MKSYKEFLTDADNSIGIMVRKVSKPPTPKTAWEKEFANRYKNMSGKKRKPK